MAAFLVWVKGSAPYVFPTSYEPAYVIASKMEPLMRVTRPTRDDPRP